MPSYNNCQGKNLFKLKLTQDSQKPPPVWLSGPEIKNNITLKKTESNKHAYIIEGIFYHYVKMLIIGWSSGGYRPVNVDLDEVSIHTYCFSKSLMLQSISEISLG